MGVGIEIGKLGVWSAFVEWNVGSQQQAEAAQELERLGYGTLWLSSMPGISAGELALHESILAVTERLVVGSSVIDVWSNPPEVVAASVARLEARYPGRFVLGVGPSHAPLVQATGGTYLKPLQQVAAFFDGLDAADPPVPVDRRVLAALGPKALTLAAERAAGAVPYLVTPDHTASARQKLGPGPLLAPEQKVVLSTDPVEARQLGRERLAIYFDLPNYTSNLLRLGFEEADFAAGGSDRLVDALVAWGDVDTVQRRVDAHFAAGADHVALQVISRDRKGLPVDAWREAAPMLGKTV